MQLLLVEAMEVLLENVFLRGFNFIDWYELDSEVVDVCNKHLGNIGNKVYRKKFC